MLIIGLAGCGGSGVGVGSISVVPPVEPPAEIPGTARFDVDVTSGRVAVTPMGWGVGASRNALLTGGAISFESSSLIDEPGDIGRKVLRVKVRNNTNERLGFGRPTRFLFNISANQTANLTDLPSFFNITTVASSATAGSADGPIGVGQLSGPSGVAVGYDGTVYFQGNDNRLRMIKGNNISTIATGFYEGDILYLRDPATGKEYLLATVEITESRTLTSARAKPARSPERALMGRRMGRSWLQICRNPRI